VKSGLERGRVMRTLRAAPPTDRRLVAPALPTTDVLMTHPGRPLGQAAALAAPAASAAGVSLDQPLREARDQFERVYFEYHLARENYSMTRVADRAGLERTHLYRKLKQLGVELGRGGRRAPVADALNEFAPRENGRAENEGV
jgi:DNA-binding NtrC family response regulator